MAARETLDDPVAFGSQALADALDASHTRAQGGTGLGLAIARRLARAMAGELRATTALGAGSIFTLDLPLHYEGGDEA